MESEDQPFKSAHIGNQTKFNGFVCEFYEAQSTNGLIRICNLQTIHCFIDRMNASNEVESVKLVWTYAQNKLFGFKQMFQQNNLQRIFKSFSQIMQIQSMRVDVCVCACVDCFVVRRIQMQQYHKFHSAEQPDQNGKLLLSPDVSLTRRWIFYGCLACRFYFAFS